MGWLLLGTEPDNSVSLTDSASQVESLLAPAEKFLDRPAFPYNTSAEDLLAELAFCARVRCLY
jgi:hypothetical protein